MMKNILILMMLMTLLAQPAISNAYHCGVINGNKIVTYGGLSCIKAKKVYLSFQRGHIPNGWNCGQSVGGYGKGKQGFTFQLTVMN